ncbi:MAG TPA: nitrate reductase subunit alpha [Vicinamibacterales bacterium]|nr:nitrate reductase subunit alpha [Vicinamibacterales bacterium]
MSWIRDLVDPHARSWEDFYRNRWQHDRVVRSTHGVNCTGSCSWLVYVKEGIVTWEMQALDYPRLASDLPGYEPRGCPRGIVFSWYLYSPVRVKYPYIRGALLDAWRSARARHADPVEAWASIVGDEEVRARYQQARGKGGLRRSTWSEALEIVAASMLYTATRYGPDRVVGFSPIPAMSMVSYAAGSRMLQLFGAALLSFYDTYADFPPAFPETWGEKTDVAESADWYNSKYIVTVGSNLNMTRTPDVHFVAEARNNGSKLVVLSPDFSEVARYADWWIPVHAGMDAAFWLAVDHVILREFHADRQSPYFTDYLKRFSDSPFLVRIEAADGGFVPGRFLRASDLARYRDVEHAEWKPLLFDDRQREPRMPTGSIGFRWQQRPGQWNLKLNDGLDDQEIVPRLSFLGHADDHLSVAFPDFGDDRPFRRTVPVAYVETLEGRAAVTTVFDLLMANFGIARGLPGEYPADYDAADSPFTPAWQERFTGIGRQTVIQFAREFARTAERTRGKCTVIIGSGVNHWYHSNLHYRAAITALMTCGCIGVNGGGMNHYTGQEKLVPAASWSTLAMAGDWVGTSRLQNGPSFHYVHSDQWRYHSLVSDAHPATGPFSTGTLMEAQVDAVRMGWLPFYPQFDQNPIELIREAERAGATTPDDIVAWTVDRLRRRTLEFAVEHPDAPENWPRVWIVWRGNAIHASAKGHEYFLRHYLGTGDSAIAAPTAPPASGDGPWRDPAARGKMDLVVDLNFRMDTSAMYSDIVLPSASWYEKDDLNTTDLHSFIHPLGAAVPPCWESRTDWDIFRMLAEKISALAPAHFQGPFRDLVTTPLLHDTPDELAQPRVLRWFEGECEPIPGRTMPHLRVVERDYANLYHRFCSLGPRLREHGVEDRGVVMPAGDLYDQFAKDTPAYEWGGRRYPSLVEARQAANMILFFAPETNGELAYRGFQHRERETGLHMVDLAESNRDVRYDLLALTDQPRRILTSPVWSGIVNGGRAYSAYCQNIERLVPWRTLTGRQHLYLDHEGYRAFGESLPTFKPRLPPGVTKDLVDTPVPPHSLMVNCLTPHGKWHIHTTYSDDLRMLTLSRGIEPLWINDKDAVSIGVADNDWVEMLNDNGAVVTRACVSARVPRGVALFYHAPERTVGIPMSPARGHRGGGTNSMTRLRLKPVLMVGGYAQHSYRFNDYGPAASDRDTYAIIHKLPRRPPY